MFGFGAWGAPPVLQRSEPRDKDPCHDCRRLLYVKLGETWYRVGDVFICHDCYVNRILRKSGGTQPIRSK